ncbi:small nuclear RNA activating complex, subunit SNAP43-domain-containing protein [Zychaea mexicana]|uniref:small nuclear RNA activating complex, subunit SNAP43-domain-containing protein n=1 Tax=Zychaea mexicana TaxID=64656 RepID=UPI0022FE624D|nr:small nuclear RNA activating complex, subunit SNAP43-domain-containing protein [Zychaea mexicana]KAI9489704.1 small nuclear RNA activating complex, subunit SNAP43-domain-containing protein [Zychaea mexicana]
MFRRSIDHPVSSLEASDLIRIDRGQRGLLKLPVIRDVDLLMATFGAQETHLFSDFMEAWKSLNFNNVHFTSIDKETRPSFMQGFYDEFLEYILSDVQNARIGALYGLYCMYFSQPSLPDPCNIRVTRDQWRIMFQFYIDGATTYLDDKEHASASFAFKRLLENNAFVHVIQTKMETHSFFELEEMKTSYGLLEEFHTMRKRRIAQDAISACRRDDASRRIDELLAKYQKAKSIACMTPQASIAAQDLLYFKTGVKETKSRLLHNVLAKSSISADENDFKKTLDNAAKAMWNSRKRRLEQYSERASAQSRKKKATAAPTDTTPTEEPSSSTSSS